MGDLEHVDRAGVDRDRLGLGIGREQHAEFAPTGEDDQGPFIWIGARERFGKRGLRRPKHFEAQSARAQLISLGDPQRRRVDLTRLRQQPAPKERVDEAVDGHPPEQFDDAARVVGLIVGDNRSRERVDALGAELRREFVAEGPTIDQDRGGARGLQQDRVALADVEHRDPQPREQAAQHALPHPKPAPGRQDRPQPQPGPTKPADGTKTRLYLPFEARADQLEWWRARRIVVARLLLAPGRTLPAPRGSDGGGRPPSLAGRTRRRPGLCRRAAGR